MKRRLAIVLMIVGVVAVVLGALSATVWRASNQVTMSAERTSSPVVTSDPGVLTMMEGDVEITASADADQPVELVIAPSTEVEAWVAGTAHQRITGASTWDTLATSEEPAAEGATETTPPLGQVDGWPLLAQEAGEVSTTWTPLGGNHSLLAITDGTDPAPQITLTWQREVTTPWLWPGVLGGGALILLGLVLAVLDSRERRGRTTLRARTARRAGADEETTVLPAVGAPAATGATPAANNADNPLRSRVARRRGASGATTNDEGPQEPRKEDER